MKKSYKKNFIKINKKFWHKVKESDSDNLLLVETSGHPVVNHSNAIVAKIIAQAKNLRIAWIKNLDTDKMLMKSYSPNSLFIKFEKIHIIKRLSILLLSIFYYIYYVLFKNKLLSFKFKKIPYGDFVYDIYLSEYSMATLHRFDFRIILIFYRVLIADIRARNILNKNNIKRVLISHYTGLKSGPLFRVAMQKKIPCYLKTGGHKIFTLSVYNNLSQIHDYPLRPSKKELNQLIKNYKKFVERDFYRLINNIDDLYARSFSLAYGKGIFSKTTRKVFLKKMKLNDRPIVFIMLHAFNDHPHSHFKKMLFKDYYDWFIQTLNFAKQDKSKNWIFKEHPANKFYLTKDLNLKKMMKNLPKNLRFVSRNSKIKTSTVLNVADTIITCLGTAGIEIPALKRTPAVIAGDSSYSGFGFTIKPQSKKQYFSTLKKLPYKPLSAKEQLRAKSCYMYLTKYCLVPFAAGPDISLEEIMKPEKIETKYFKRILKNYKNKSTIIYNQFNEYVKKIKKENFCRLNSLPKAAKT